MEKEKHKIVIQAIDTHWWHALRKSRNGSALFAHSVETEKMICCPPRIAAKYTLEDINQITVHIARKFHLKRRTLARSIFKITILYYNVENYDIIFKQEKDYQGKVDFSNWIKLIIYFKGIINA